MRLSSHNKKQPTLLPEISVTTDQMPATRPLITSIRVLLLKDFITCVIYKDYSVLGDGSDLELENVFTHLLSQYYAAKKDESMLDYVKLIREIKAMELRKALVQTWTIILHERYSPAAAINMQEFYQNHTFSEETYIKDLDWVRKAEKSEQRQLNELIERLELMDKDKVSSEATTTDQQYSNFITELMDINKIEGVKYDLNTITVLEYAIAQGRKSEYIESLKKQADGR